MPDPNLPNEAIDNATQQRLRTDEAYDKEQASKDFQYGGGGSISEFNYESPGTFGQTYSPQPVNTSIAYSGSDCNAFIVTYGQIAKDSFIPLKNLGAISYSIHRDKAPVRKLGSFEAAAYTKGTRTIAGSIVIINFDRAAFFELVAGTDIYGANGAEIELSDNIPPFDILLVFAEENKGRRSSKWTNGMIGPPKPDEAADFSYMWIRDVHFVDEGSVTGTDEAYLETTFQYVAKDLEYLKPNNIISRDQDINAVAADISGTPATTEYQRATPHRMFMTQTEELATYEDRVEVFNLVFDRAETRTFNDTFDWTVTDEANADALRVASTSGEDSIWQRPATIVKMDPAQVNVHASGNLTAITELSTTAKPVGTGFEAQPLNRGAYQYDPATINSTGEITLQNAYIFAHPRTKWQEFFNTNFPPKFGNKYQFDLHNIAKPRVEEAQVELVYDGSNPNHTPGQVNFPIPNADVEINPHAGFANDNDPMLTAVSPVREHDITIVDAGNVTIDIIESDVQQTLTESFEIIPVVEDTTINYTYTNDSDQRATVHVGIPGHCNDPDGNPYDVVDSSTANGPTNCTGLGGTWVPRSAVIYPFLNDPSMQPVEVSITDHTGTVSEGPNNDQFEIVSYNMATETFEIKAPPNKLVDASITNSRPGPAMGQYTLTTTDYPVDPWDQAWHEIPTSTAGPGGTPVLSLDGQQVSITSVGQISGISYSSAIGDIKLENQSGEEGHEIIIDPNSGLPSHSLITWTGFNEINPLVENVEYGSPSSVTTQATDPSGTYIYSTHANVEQFPFYGSAANAAAVVSIDLLDVNYSDTSLFHPELTPPAISLASFAAGSENFTVEGARSWKYYANMLNTTTIPSTGKITILADLENQGGFDNYQFKGLDGNPTYVNIEAFNFEGHTVFQRPVPVSMTGDDYTIDITQWADTVALSQGFWLLNIEDSLTNQPEGVNSISVEFEYMFSGELPFGMTYTAVESTPLSKSFTLQDPNGKLHTPDWATVDESTIEVEVINSPVNTTNSAATFTFDAATNVLTVDNLEPMYTSQITYSFKYHHKEIFDTTIDFIGILLEGNNSAATDLVLNLGPLEPVNFDVTTGITIQCADSSAIVLPSEFGISVGGVQLNSETANYEVQITGIPPMVIMELNRPGWLGCLWDFVFGSSTMPKGNLNFIADFKVYDPSQTKLEAALTYKTVRKPDGSLITLEEHTGTLGVDGYIVSKTYDDGTDGNLFQDPQAPLSIQIINPKQILGSGSCDCSSLVDPMLTLCNEAVSNNLAIDPGSCSNNGGTWSGGGPVLHTMQNISNPYLPYSQVYEITDYTNQPSPPEIKFQVDGLRLLGKDTIGPTFNFDLTYDVQRGALPITVNYVRATGETYPAIETYNTYTFEAAIPLFKVDLGTSYGDYVCSDGALTTQGECMCGAGGSYSNNACAGGTCSDNTSTSENICRCGAGGTWTGVDCATGAETGNSWAPTPTTGNTWTKQSGNAQGPVDLVNSVKWQGIAGALGASGPTLTSIDPELDDDGNIVGPDTLSLADPLQAYMFGKDPNTQSGSPVSVFFPTGIDPNDGSALTDGTNQNSLHDPYEVEVDYRSLVSYIPASKYTAPGYIMTGLLNVTGYEAIELVLDIERNSVNYYRGYGVCQDSTYLDAKTCTDNGSVWEENDEEDRVLCEEGVGGTWLREQDSIFPGLMKAVGVCELSDTSINTLINDQRIIQFGFWLIGPGTDAQGFLALNQPIKERFVTLEEAVNSMQESYKENFGV